MTARTDLVRVLADTVIGEEHGTPRDVLALNDAGSWVDAILENESAVRAFFNEFNGSAITHDDDTETVRVAVTGKDRAAYRLTELAWPGESEVRRQRWYRRVVFEEQHGRR